MSEETKLILEALGKISDKMEEMDKRLSNVEDKVTDIQLTLETETNQNIKIIAEGHALLAEKVDNALRIDNDKEMMKLRLNSMENEIRRLKKATHIA